MDDMKTFLLEEDPKRIFSLTEMSKDFISEQGRQIARFTYSYLIIRFIFGMIR